MKRLLNSTKDRILSAAEQLFAETGVATTSLRTITALARVNLAAVNYHFGSKEALVDAVYERRLRPLNRERLLNLDGVLAGTTGNEAPPVEAIVEAFVRPILSAQRASEHGPHAFLRLLAQTYTEASRELRELVMRENRQVLDRYRDALARALPELSEEELYLRIRCSLGALNQLLSGGEIARMLSGGREPGVLTDADLDRLVAFVVAGFKAAPALADSDRTPKHAAG